MKSTVDKHSFLRWDSPSVKVLFQLLRIALGKEETSPLPNDVNWQEVYNLSQTQGVGAIACDGMLKLENCNIDEELRYKWLGYSVVMEKDAMRKLALACQLANLYAQHDIKTYVLKGISFASYYPNPLHRFSSDLDICLRNDFEKGNQIVENIGVKVDRNDSKHSHFIINSIPVENHQFCVGLRGNRRNKKIERNLRRLLDEEGNKIDGSNINKPVWLFNALFYMCHARTHFLISKGITLRHVCDWMVLRGSHESIANINEFWHDCERLGLLKFAKAMDEVAYYVEGKGVLHTSGERMINDILAINGNVLRQNKFRAHMRMFKMMWSNRWKFKYYSDTTAIGMITMYIYGYLFDRNPKF